MDNQNFKSFVKKETNKEKKEKIYIFWKNNSENIRIGIFTLSIIFSIFYVVFSKSRNYRESNILKLNSKNNVYVNISDTTYSMDIKYLDDSFIKNIELTKDEYLNYSKNYNKGVTKFLYDDIDVLYAICFFYLVILVILLLFL